jgi:hypothetical protein
MMIALAAAVSVGLWAGTAGAAAGNGEASKSATTILADAKAATSASSTVQVSGIVIEKGKRASLNVVTGQAAGGGTITTSGATINIIVIPPNLYLKADKASWTKLAKSAAAGQLFADRWLQTTTSDQSFGSFGNLLDTSKLTQDITTTGRITKGAVTTFHGKQAVPLTGTKNGTLYVAATGQPYILGLVGTGTKKGSEILFTNYGTAQVPAAPSDAINVDQLEQSTSNSQ